MRRARSPGPLPIRCSSPCWAALGRGDSAMATVAAPRSCFPSERSMRLGTRNRPSAPEASSAAASATDAVPISAATTLEGVGTSTLARLAASCNRSGQPSCLARASKAGSSPLRSIVLSPATASLASPASWRAVAMARSISWRLVSRSHPMPSHSTGGASNRSWWGLDCAQR